MYVGLFLDDADGPFCMTSEIWAAFVRRLLANCTATRSVLHYQ
jgi:hypothetical protein